MLHFKYISCNMPHHASCLSPAWGSLPVRSDFLCASSASSCLGELEEAKQLIWSHEAARVISSAERWARHRPEVWAVEGRQAGRRGEPREVRGSRAQGP